jgi:hypothetical protein
MLTIDWNLIGKRKISDNIICLEALQRNAKNQKKFREKHKDQIKMGT